MKYGFLLQRQFAYIGHYLAQALKAGHGAADFCGYVYLRSSNHFLKNQKEISYSSLLLDQDLHEGWKNEKLDHVYLTDLEKRIGLPSLWPYLIADRVIMQEQMVREYPHDRQRYTHEELLKMLQVRAKAIDAFMEKEKPDVVFGIPPGALGSMLFYHMAKAHGAKAFYVVQTNLLSRWLLTEDYRTFTPVDNIFRAKREELLASKDGEWARDFLKKFRDKPLPNFAKATPMHQPVTRKQQFRFLNPMKAVGPIREVIKAISRHLKSDERNDYDYINPLWQTWDLIKRKFRNLRGNDDLYDAFDPKEDFAFYPLHYEPELSLLVLAPAFTDQIALIRQIAKSLPAQMKLCVKEHPVMAQFRPRAFYEQLKKIPNVKLISPTLSGSQITPHAKLVLTITGTVGWEACLFGIPVVSFGHQNFNALANVTACRNFEELPLVIRRRLDVKDYDEADVVAYLAALYRVSFEMDLRQLWEEETNQEKRRNGMKPLADALHAESTRVLGHA